MRSGPARGGSLLTVSVLLCACSAGIPEVPRSVQEAWDSPNAASIVPPGEAEIVERFGPTYPPRPSDHPIQVYRVRLPDSPFKEIGMVRVIAGDEGSGSASRAGLIEKLKAAARDLGGDGIAGIDESSITQVVGIEVVGSWERLVMTAIVIRFE